MSFASVTSSSDSFSLGHFFFGQTHYTLDVLSLLSTKILLLNCELCLCLSPVLHLLIFFFSEELEVLNSDLLDENESYQT